MAVKKMSKYLWAEKFRPEKLEDMLLPATFRRFFEEHISKGQIPNLLLYSSTPGSGKTSLSHVLCNEIDADYIYVNVSTEGGIDTLRSTIQDFASTKSFNKKPKVVILDEFDGASQSLQAGLRGFTEEFHDSCRFIITCNFITKIIPALREGRFMEFNFDITDKDIAAEVKPKQIKRLSQILKFEKIEFDPATITKLVEQSYPNMRRMITVLQKSAATYGMINDSIFKTSTIDNELYSLILAKKFTAARTFILENSYNCDELYSAFYHNLVPMVDNKSTQARMILLIAQYQHMSATSIDKEITLAALLLEIIAVL